MKDLGSQFEPVVDVLKKIGAHHAIIIILLGLFAIVYAVYSINQVLTLTDDEAYRTTKQSESVKTKFDEETISKLDRLNARQEQMTLDLPTGRINPFVE